MAALLATGCVQRAVVPGGLEGPGYFAFSTPVATDPVCKLLTVEEASLAMNGSIEENKRDSAQQPALPGMAMCTVRGGNETKTSLSWGLLSKSPVKRFNDYKRVNQRYVQDFQLTGNDALWDRELRTLLVVAGNRVVAMRLSVDKPDLSAGGTKGGYLRETSERLALRALERLK